MAASVPLPVVLITGAPGAGKTTFLNRLLAELEPSAVPAVISHRIAVEFGLDIHPVRAGSDAQRERMLRGEMFDFGSGCVCCSPTGDLLQHLLAVKRALEPEPPFERDDVRHAPPSHVLIETTGIADVEIFAQLLCAHAELQGVFALAAVVALADATAAPLLFAAPPDEASALARRGAEQLAAADAVLVTRAESREHFEHAREVLTHALAATEPAAGGARPPAAVMEASAVGWAELLAMRTARPDRAAAASAPRVRGPISLGRGGSGHDGAFQTVCVVEDGAVCDANLVELLERLGRVALGAQRDAADADPPLASSARGVQGGGGGGGGGGLFRIKGILSISSELDGIARTERRAVEWRVGQPALSTRALDDGAAPLGRTLAHTFVAGVGDASAPPSCTLLFVGAHVPVNSLRAELWRAMVPRGFALGAQIELDFACAQAHAQRQPAPTQADGGEADDAPAWAVRRLRGWLPGARDAYLFWVDGAFCALADFAPDAGASDGRRWALEESRLRRAPRGAKGAARGFLLLPPAAARPAAARDDGQYAGVEADDADDAGDDGAIDLATGRRARDAGLAPILQKLELRILGDAIYVSCGG